MDMMEKKIEEEMKRDMEVTQKTQEICRFYLTGTCKFGKSCKFFHPSEEDHIAESLVFENDHDCCICYDKVLARDRQFGLLSKIGCDAQRAVIMLSVQSALGSGEDKSIINQHPKINTDSALSVDRKAMWQFHQIGM